MAGKYGSASVVISIDDTPGGTLRDISAHVLSIGGVKREAITQESSPFGVAYESHTPTGKHRVGDIEISGRYDTTASTGPHVIFSDPDDGPQDATRTFTFTPGDSKTFTMECRVASYEMTASNGNLTDYKAVIRQAGAGAWS